jgi:microcystin-dependent protein
MNIDGTSAGTTTGTNGTSLSKGVASGSGPNSSVLNNYTSNGPNTALNPATIGTSGGNQPFSIRDPYLVVNYSIATQGIFPSRN